MTVLRTKSLVFLLVLLTFLFLELFFCFRALTECVQVVYGSSYVLSEKRAAFARSARRGTAPTTDGRHYHRSSTVAMLRPVMHGIAL